MSGDGVVATGVAPAVGGRRGHAMPLYLKNASADPTTEIKRMLKKYFEPQSLGLGVVPLRDVRNGMADQLQSIEGLQKLADAIEEHPNTKDSFICRKLMMRKPEFRVSEVDPDVLPAKFLLTLRHQNPVAQIEPDKFNLMTFYKDKSGNVTHIVDVTPSGYEKIKDTTQLNLVWTSCPIYKNFYVQKCQRCSTYGHTKRFCPS